MKKRAFKQALFSFIYRKISKKTRENCGKYIYFEIENVAYVKVML